MPRDVVTQVEPAFSAPAAFVRQLMDAVVGVMPFDNRGEPDSQPGPVEMRTTFSVLEPFLATYTVTDVGLLLNMVYASWALQRNARASDVDGEAIGRIQSLLEDFLADAHASTPECTEVRAYFLGMCMDDAYNHPSDCTIEGLRSQIHWDISDLRSGHFDGETFGGRCQGDEYPLWLKRSIKRVERYKAAAQC